MGLLLFFGLLMIAFGPSVALFVFTISKCPVRIILFVVGCFLWLFSLLLSALVWQMTPSLKEQLAFVLAFSVVFQELARFTLYKLFQRAAKGFKEVLSETESKSISGDRLSYVLGFGFGFMNAFVSYDNVLMHLSGPATVGIQGHLSNYFFISAWITNTLVFNNIFWTIISFKLWKNNSYIVYSLVPITHFLVSYLTLLEPTIIGMLTKLIVQNIIALLFGYASFKAVGGSCLSFFNFLKQFSRPLQGST